MHVSSTLAGEGQPAVYGMMGQVIPIRIRIR